VRELCHKSFTSAVSNGKRQRSLNLEVSFRMRHEIQQIISLVWEIRISSEKSLLLNTFQIGSVIYNMSRLFRDNFSFCCTAEFYGLSLLGSQVCVQNLLFCC